ncbi:hypothetical protein ZWY2020_009892 [Hordeum vulgare]|nr:hypothetical protein ZWY2020_009892 [Hordeum vulgare]
MFAPVTCRNKRSRYPRLQRWVRHAQARQNASSQVAVLESVVVAPPSQRSDSEYLGHGPAAKVYMANSHESPRQTGRDEHEVGESSAPSTSPFAPRRTRQSNVEVFRTPVLNLAAAAKIGDSLQPSDSEAGRGIEQIRALLHTAQQQNSAVSQSHNMIHNSSVHANTHRSVFSPDSHQRHRGGSRSMNPEDRRHSRTPPWGGPYGPRHHDGRRSVGDTYDPRPDARGFIAQRKVDRSRAHRDGHNRDRPSGSKTIVSGPEYFSRAIRSADIPPNFRLATGISKFTGESKPETWLDDYRVAIQIGGGDDQVAMKHLPLMLDGSARAWLNQLAPSSIYSWADLARVFIRTFEGTCKRPAGLVELESCPKNEPRDFIQRWTILYHGGECHEHQASAPSKRRYRDLYLKFGRTGDISMSKMMEIAACYANGEEEDRICSGKDKAVADGDGNNTRKQKQKAPSTPQAEAAAVTNAKFKGKEGSHPKKKQFGNHILDPPCPIHTKMDEEGNAIFPKHTTRQCRLLIQGFDEGQPSEKDNEQDDEDKEDPFPQVHATLMIFADVESKSRLKLVNREVNMATPTNPMFLKWSQTAITFDQSDHPAHVPTPGRRKAKSLGQISFDVVFGSDKNFRKEKLTFEVVDFQNAYHTILGRPAYARFMARPCYVYLKLKMPGPKGVITVTRNRQRAEECLQQGSRIADQQMAILELDEYKKTADPADLMHSKKPASEFAFQSAGDTKKVSIHPMDDTAAPTNISTTLDPK